MSLGCKQGGLGLRSASVHALGGYFSSLSSCASLLEARFPALPVASVALRLAAVGEAWSSQYGEMPKAPSQRALSNAVDHTLLALLIAAVALRTLSSGQPACNRAIATRAAVSVEFRAHASS